MIYITVVMIPYDSSLLLVQVALGTFKTILLLLHCCSNINENYVIQLSVCSEF